MSITKRNRKTRVKLGYKINVTKNSDNTLTHVNEISETKEITEGQEATNFTPYLKRLNLLPFRDI